ncbi:hypothetical protein C8F04DRAFT_1270802 [Mycena alexandri]|uniref:Uncharacterized protein n=1 Tax=Mycena alexandri TaxID=1745969 RepID=A0AAD6SBM9_9AGAR|nr:hypothetical protein C8F04DRAFT_1270802 [Mycena alexandri]
MRIPFCLMFAVVLSLDACAAPVPNTVVNEFALEARKAQVATKKAPVKPKAPAVKSTPPPKKVAPKPAKPAAAPKPVAKKPVVAPKPVAPAVAPKPVAKKPVAKPAVAPKPVAKKPAAKPAAAPKPVAKKPATKPAVAPEPVAKKPVTVPADKPAAKAPVAKPPAKSAPPATKPSAKPAKATPAAKVPASCAVRKKPAAKARADTEDLTARASTPITACDVDIRASNAAALCEEQTVTFTFVNDALVHNNLRRRLTPRVKNDDGEEFVPDDESTGIRECDHVLELQVLKKTLGLPGGVCETMDAMIASPNSGLTADDKVDFMADIKAAINRKSNLFFLDKKLNQVKRDEVTASLKGQAPQASLQTDLSDQRFAVNEYLTDKSVNGPSTRLATTLDTLIGTMLTKVQTAALANIKRCGGTPADEAKVKAAKANLQTPPTITSAWANVLSHVADQAEI